MKIKHYDHDLQKWVIDGVSNSSDLELSNPAYLDMKVTQFLQIKDLQK